jgi:uncharacterized protein (DUF2062 family)
MIRVRDTRTYRGLSRAARWLLGLKGSPESIALGFAVGVFIALTPTVGVQTLLVLVAATLIRMNLPAAYVSIWISNPLTTVPIYLFNYWIGTLILWMSAERSAVGWLTIRGKIAEVGAAQGFWPTIRAGLIAIWDLGLGVAGPLWLGSFVVALAAAVLAYVVTLPIARFYRSKKWRELLKARRVEGRRIGGRRRKGRSEETGEALQDR